MTSRLVKCDGRQNIIVAAALHPLSAVSAAADGAGRVGAEQRLPLVPCHTGPSPRLQLNIPLVAGVVKGSVPRFDFANETDRQLALAYRQHEVGAAWRQLNDVHQVPFVVLNVPDIATAAEGWTVDTDGCWMAPFIYY